MNKRVLLIDDDEEMLTELLWVFEKESITVATAKTGIEALTLVETDKYDVCVVDVKLPDCNGLELVEKLKGKDEQMTYIIVTAYASLESSVDAVHKGIFDYIVKPFNPQELVSAVKNAFKIEESIEKDKKNSQKVIHEKDDLEIKILKLKKLNELFLRREERIMELKKEVNSLLRELNRDIKYGAAAEE